MSTKNQNIALVDGASTGANFGHAFWDRLWRSAGIQSVGLFVIASIIYAYRPQVAAVFAGLAVLNLMWFAAAFRTVLADAGRDGWGAAATAASAAVGGLFFPLIAIATVSGYSAADSALAPVLNNFAWAGFVLTSFPRAMLIMAGTFGFWRAGLISNTLFAAGVTAVVLVLLSGTTWMSSGFWAPDGAFSRFVSPAIGLVWIIVASKILLTRSPGIRAGW